MSEAPIRVRIIGAGRNTCDWHAIPGLLAQPGVEIGRRRQPVVELEPQGGGRAGATMSVRRADWTEIVAMDEVDAVCIGT